MDSGAPETPAAIGAARHVDWPRVLPYLLLHACCLGALWVGTSPVAVGIAAALFVLRMLAATAFHHRYFSHRAFRTSRAAQLAFALLAVSAVQRGPLRRASHHRHHHAHSDRPGDSHSASLQGFCRGPLGWILARENFAARLDLVPDLARYPERRWLDRFDVSAPALLAATLYPLGAFREQAAPALGTSGGQLVVRGLGSRP